MLYYADGVYFADQLNGTSPASPGLYNQKTADCARIPRPAPASVSSARSATRSQPVSQCVAGSQECRLTHNDLTETLLLRCSTLGNIDESLRIYMDAHEPFPAKVTKSTTLQRMSRKLVILKVTVYTSHGFF